jgi:REP element-mobilizing transposase RayT
VGGRCSNAGFDWIWDHTPSLFTPVSAARILLLDKEQAMSYTNLLYHVVYGTKARAPFINAELKADLYKYLGGIVRGLGCVPIEINGMSEHVHLLVRIRPTISVSEFLSKLKSNSSRWARRRSQRRFGWQDEYGAFTVSESQVKRVRQ